MSEAASYRIEAILAVAEKGNAEMGTSSAPHWATPGRFRLMV